MGMKGLERRLERMVDGVFRRSRNSVRPIEIGRRLLREMDDQRSVDAKGERVVPNDFVVFLSPQDHAGFADIETALRTELIEAVREYAREESYHFMGPVDLDLRVDNDLKSGRFGITSQLKESASGARPGYVILPSGDRVELDEENIVGRMNDCQIVLSDTNISRRHARIARSGTGFVASDLGSTNGTFINGERLISEKQLTDGDTITIGKANLRFEAN